MGERIDLGESKGKLRLKVARPRRAASSRPRPRALISNGCVPDATRRLISWADAANCRKLREETGQILSTVTDQERQVLRMRFGISEARHWSVEEIARHYALECGQILEIEAQALRKLRHRDGHSQKSVSRR